MIWFQCKQCGKTHGRQESSVGSLVFCECGHGNTVPWESTTAAPAAPEPPRAEFPTLEPIKFEQPLPPERNEPRERRSRRPARKYRVDPNFCLNHTHLPSQTTCTDCGEAFCNDCVLEVDSQTVCGPCKNFRIRAWQQPPRVSGFALFSVFLALVAGLFGAVAVSNGASPTMCLIALLPHVGAMLLGGLGLRSVEKHPELGGRSLAITGILMAGMGIFLTVLFAFFTPGLLS